MKRFLIFISLGLLSLSFFCTREKYHVINRMYVYHIQQHNDSIYFSTQDSGIFRFSPDCPESLVRVGGSYPLPIRSIAFSKEGVCFAASYHAGVHYVDRDTLLPVIGFPQPAWSIKMNTDGALWLAGIQGIFKQQDDSLVLFNRIGEVHDIAFYGKELAVAHRNGISIFNRETGVLIREFCKGIVCWSMTQFDSLFVGGGLNICAIINKDRCSTITFGPSRNMVWATALDSLGNLYIATQKGLFFAKKGSDKAECIGFRSICIKSLLIDKKGRLWIGKFVKDTR